MRYSDNRELGICHRQIFRLIPEIIKCPLILAFNVKCFDASMTLCVIMFQTG